MKDKLAKFSILRLLELGMVVEREGGQTVARATYPR
jgi:hypothetical protein